MPTYWVPPSYTKFQSNPSSWSLDIRLHNFGSNWVPTVHFPQDRFFWENCLLLLSTHCVLLYYILKKNDQRENHQTRLHSFGPNWAQVALSTKREFFAKVDQHCFGLLYPIMLHNFKRILRQQIMRIRFA